VERKSLAQLVRDREVDAEQAELRKQFLAAAPKVWVQAEKVFGPLKISRVRRIS
jgi:hypothetical protein